MTVFLGACLQSFDPENLYSTQCHLGHLVSTFSEWNSSLRGTHGPGGRGIRVGALIRLSRAGLIRTCEVFGAGAQTPACPAQG